MQHRKIVPGPNAGEQVGEVVVDGITFTLFAGLLTTVGAARKKTSSYVTIGRVQIKWYELTQGAVPMRVQENQDAREAAADEATTAGTTATPENTATKTPSGKKGLVPAIRRLIAAGKTDEQIFEELRPTLRVTKGVIAWARRTPLGKATAGE